MALPIAEPIQYLNSWTNEKEKKKALAQATQAFIDGPTIQHSVGSNVYHNISGTTSVRDSFNREDYENFRQDEAIPTNPKDAMRMCDKVYQRNGIIRNVIDTMGDFTVQGINIVHPTTVGQEIYTQWAKQVFFKDRSERFANTLYRLSNVCIQKTTAQLPGKDRRSFMKALAKPDLVLKPEKVFDSREIPWSYTFLNPTMIIPLHEELNQFIGEMQYGITIPQKVYDKLKNPKTEEERNIIAQIPLEIMESINAGNRTVKLDSKKFSMYFYKKDDYEVWAYPMIYSVLGDINALEKMKLADLSALDGATSRVRLWTLGNLEHKIAATPAAVNRLGAMISNTVGGGTVDIIWGPELDFKESSTDSSKFLGSEKYQASLSAIFAGLGIPPTLTGSSTNSGFTNNFISLKTLTERLRYGRDILVEFWTKELAIVQKAFGLREPAQILFDRMILTDEAAEKALLIQLADRDLISVESLQALFGQIPEIERLRSRREEKLREAGRMNKKAGPWHNPTPENKLKEISLQTGQATPSEVGLELDENKAGQVKMMKLKPAVKPGRKQPGVPSPGRPYNSNDTTKRKQKVVKPRSKGGFQQIELIKKRQTEIANVVNPIFLAKAGKKNLRQLTNIESEQVERLKFIVLANIVEQRIYTEEFSETSLAQILSAGASLPQELSDLYEENLMECIEPTLDEQRSLQAWACNEWVSTD